MRLPSISTQKHNKTAASPHPICLGPTQPGGSSEGPSALQVAKFTNVTQLAFALYAVCALLGDGYVSCIGNNVAGDLGLGIKDSGYAYDFTHYVKLHAGYSVSSISANADGFCVLYTQGSVSCWGFPPFVSFFLFLPLDF